MTSPGFENQTTDTFHSLKFRVMALVISWVALASLGLQFILSVVDDLEKNKPALGAVWRLLGYYTILTNLLIFCTMALLAFKKINVNTRRGQSFLAFNTIHIVIVGVVYHLLLAPHLNEPHGWGAVSNFGFHTFTPLATIGLWVFWVSKNHLTYRDPLVWLLYPLIYFAYVHVRGYLSGWYPYPFMDVNKIGVHAALIYALILAVFFWLLGLGLVALGRWQIKSRED